MPFHALQYTKNGLKAAKFVTLTAVQRATLPHALAGESKHHIYSIYSKPVHITRVGQNCVHTPYTTVQTVISSQKHQRWSTEA
jgi:hypothetical protein